MTLEARKYDLIKKITGLENEAVLSRLEVAFSMLAEDLEMLKKVTKPMRKKLIIEDLVKEQRYKGVDRSKFQKLVDEIDIEEPIEELLSMI